jgi:hydroxymethylpyrimidine pyrophosphatase-like HAD family hydrolase
VTNDGQAPYPDDRSRLPAVVATDLDGTLLDSEGRVGARNVAVLTRLAELGVHIVFVTGRPPEMVGVIAEEVGHTGLAICSNGAIVLDMTTLQPVIEYLLDADVARKIWANVSAAVPGCTYGVQLDDRFICEAAYPYDPWYPGGPEIVPAAADLFDVPVAKLVIRQSGVNGDLLLAQCRAAVAGGGLTDRAELTISGPTGFVEVSAAGVSKASTLAHVCEQWGIGPDGVVAFGDMPNDVSMLGWAGLSYVMHGGHPDAAAVANGTAPSNEDSGVAQVLEQLFAPVL